MIAGQGLFQLTTRSETYRYTATVQNAGGARKDQGSSVAVPAGALSGPMRGFWEKAAKTASANLPSAETLKHLEDASQDDNKEISAQKMEQAKAKLQSLRLQAQLAAASGDKQTLKRIAQQVAAAARDVAAAAKDLAGGIAGSVADTGGTGGADMPSAAQSQDPSQDQNPSQDQGRALEIGTDGTGAAAGSTTIEEDAGPKTKPDKPDRPIYAQEPAADENKLAWGQRAMRSLNDDASAALAQARGLLAFLATTARARRKASEDDNDQSFFDDLKRSIDAAEQDMRAGFGTATQEMLSTVASGGTEDAGGSSVTMTQMTVMQVTETASLINITI